jgi:nucleotide-binding universal stress UspA family protein
VPQFWDRPEHDHAAWSREFLARNAPAAGRHLEVRSGWPSDQILEVAATERADMIALGWRRRLAHDRAAVVRDVLARTPVRVILVPDAA